MVPALSSATTADKTYCAGTGDATGLVIKTRLICRSNRFFIGKHAAGGRLVML